MFAQSQYEENIYKSYISGDMKVWKSNMDQMIQVKKKSDEFKMSLINTQIGYIGWCIGENKLDEASIYLDSAKSYLNELQEDNYKPSYIQSHLGMTDGLSIGLNYFLAPFIGPGIIDKAKLAIKLNSKNPNGYILYANSKYYMWAMLGGSKTEALKYYHKAEKIMEQNGLNVESWNYLSLLTMIAHAYEEIEDLQKANEYYKKILKIEPNFSWVKNELYPEFLKKCNNEK